MIDENRLIAISFNASRIPLKSVDQQLLLAGLAERDCGA
jgi:hypothetical protein